MNNAAAINNIIKEAKASDIEDYEMLLRVIARKCGEAKGRVTEKIEGQSDWMVLHGAQTIVDALADDILFERMRLERIRAWVDDEDIAF